MSAACFHCGLPVDAPGRWRAQVAGAVREFCCAGCEAVATAIAAGGLERYYETRTAPAPAPQPCAPAAAYDEPQALAQFAAPAGEGLLEATLILERVRCAACLWLVEQTLARTPGVRRASVNYATHRATVAWDPRATRPSAIIAAVRAIGYDAAPWDPQRQTLVERDERRAALWRLFVAGFGAMQTMMYAFPAYIDEGAGTLAPEAENLMRWAAFALTLPVLIFSCGPFFAGAAREIRRLRPGMDTPIAIGIAAGFSASAWATFTGAGAVYFDSIAMLVFLLLAARYLELAVRQRAARALDRLARWVPESALRLRDPTDPGSVERVAAHALVAGDRVLVPAGERVPADGTVEAGSSTVDESLLTGEPAPIAKSAGARVAAGTLNLEQPIVVRAERAGSGTRAAAIARLAERAAAEKPRLVALADRIAHATTWAVLATAAFAWWHSADPWIAIAVLVATCPCALALGAPLALSAAAGRLMQAGVALKRASALETLAATTDVVLDKTGTLTRGRFSLRGLRTFGTADEAACLALARALEAGATHPLARAFDGPGPRAPLSGLENHPGRGIAARGDAGRVRIGTAAFCAELAGAPAPEAAPPDRAATPVWLADERGWLAVFWLEDALRADAAQTVRALAQSGLRLHLVSGDRAEAVGALASRLEIARFVGGATPEEKIAYVERLQREGRIVAMVGDGLNDAPVLARAHAAIAIGSGADAAQARADFVLLAERTEARLAAAAECFAVARRAMRIVRQNFAWASAYNLVALPLAAGGFVGPWEAALGMAASSFIVVLNAARAAGGAATGDGPWKASSSSFLCRSRSYC
ncbi:MAG: heavy metal translocating P-type ATPase [Burkholderiales bacterium]|nr:heavy metal translocating P-type ATPase [Burkholderiales bacterium]